MLFKSKFVFVGAVLLVSVSSLADSESCWNPQGASALTVGNVDGGNSGAFVRESSQPGFDGLQSCVNIPNFEDSEGGEPQCLYNPAPECPRSKAEEAAERAHPHNLKRTPYLYLGFKSINNYTVETGLEYEAGCCYMDHNKKDRKNYGHIVMYKQPGFRIYHRNVMDLPPGQLTQKNTNIRYVDKMRFQPGDQVCMTSTLDPVSKNFDFHIDGRRVIKGRLTSIEKKDVVFASKIGSLGPNAIKQLSVRRVTEISTSNNGMTVGGFSTGVQELKNTSLNVDWKKTEAKGTLNNKWVPFNQSVVQIGGDAPCNGSVTWPAQYTKAPLPNGSSDLRSVGDHFEAVAYQSEETKCTSCGASSVIADVPAPAASAQGSAN